MITKEVELLLNVALKEAISRQHEYVLMEHVLYAICQSSYGREFLERCGANIQQLVFDLDNYLKTNVEKKLSDKKSPLTSVMVERSINRAVKHSLASDQEVCDIPDILVSMMEEKESYSVFLLYQENISRFKIIKQIIHFRQSDKIKINVDDRYSRISKNRQTQNFEDDRFRKKDHLDDPNEEEQLLSQYFVNLSLKAREKKIDPLVGRKKELKQIINVLARRKKNNVILVGDPGVGKTAIVEGLAAQIEDKNLHPFFNRYQVYSLDIGSLLSGTKFRGDFEERINKIIKIFKKKPNHIIFIDEIHMLVGAGATNGSQMDASNLFKGILSEGDIRVIGTTTYEEYQQQLKKDHALSRRFEKIQINEATVVETIDILNRLKLYYEKFHRVEFSEKVIESLPELSKQYFPEKMLPDGAIDLMDVVGAHVKLESEHSKKSMISFSQVEKIIYQLTGIPVRKVKKGQKSHFENLEKNIKKDIFGQVEAVDVMVKAIKLANIGLIERDKTMGAFLFTGPTGVGKTELCKSICQHLDIHLIRLDMSEYMESHSVSKLIGAPPGYIGYNDKSVGVVDQVRKYPYSLVLLDEIEKAHADVLNVFLQVMDHGHLKDSSGNSVSFEHTFLVMTSNLGAQEMAGNQMGFLEKTSSSPDQSINSFFSPEFRNRLTKIVPFNFLEEVTIKKIIRKLIGELNDLLKEKKVKVVLKSTAVNYLVKNGFDLKMGARPIKRIIDQDIKDQLVDHLLFGHLENGGEVIFFTKNDRLQHFYSERVDHSDNDSGRL